MNYSVEPNERVTFGLAYADEHLLVVEKPAGVPTQPGKGHQRDTLLNGLFTRYGRALQNLGARRDYGLLHRLDKDTSGLLVVALGPEAYDRLRDDFANRRVRKFYWAVCDGHPKRPTGVIKVPPTASTNTIASEVTFTLDIRHPEDSVVAEAQRLCAENFERIAKEDGKGVTFSLTQDTDSPATKFDPECIAAVERAANKLVGQDGWLPLTSGAGHDSVYTNNSCNMLYLLK